MLHELHITVERPKGVVGIERAWAEACEMTGSKPLLIRLQPQGTVQMMNAQAADIDPDDLQTWISDRVGALPNEFKVVRIKAEVPLDKGIEVYDRPYYHECHVKVLSNTRQSQECARIAERMGWVVSSNLYLPRVAGMVKWYLTQRRYSMPALRASEEFLGAWYSISPNMPPAARMEMETVVSDTNPALDAGWAGTQTGRISCAEPI